MKQVLMIVVAGLILHSGLLMGQSSTSINISSYYDDNLFRSPDPETDVLTQIGIRLSYDPQETKFSYYMKGNYFSYAGNTSRNFLLATIGTNYGRSFGKKEEHDFYFGADWTGRIDQDAYNYYDYNQLYAFTSLKLDMQYFFLKAGYNYRYRSYVNLPELTNSRHYGFIQLNKSFPTKTSLILESDLGYKSFAGQVIYNTSSEGVWGHGRNSGMYSYVTESSIPSMSHLILLTRVAQSLHPRVGVYVQYRKQISLTDQTSYLNVESYFQDEELFDDPFSYSSETVSSQLTWVMPWRMKLQVGGGALSKEYISEQAFVSAEDTVGSGGIRKDDRTFLYANLSKNFFIGKTWLKLLKLTFEYSYIDNRSNSYWYDYKNNVTGLNIQWNF